jgi:O-antigen ligase
MTLQLHTSWQSNWRARERIELAWRTVLFTAVFLLIVVPLRPFSDLGDPNILLAWETGDTVNQVVFTGAAVILAIVMRQTHYRYLLSLSDATLVATLCWFCVSVVASQNPDLSLRRLAFTLIGLWIVGCWLLLPRGLRHLSTMLTVLVGVVIFICYAGVALAPHLAIHQLSDLLEPQLDGSWRGLFGHKNEAGAAMALFFLIGLFIARTSTWIGGSLIALSSAIFLLLTGAKTSMLLLPFTLLISHLCSRAEHLRVRMLICLAPLVALITVTLLACYSERVANALDLLMFDASFTGRTDVWRFALENALERPVTGHGYMAFWRTDELMSADRSDTWANIASSSHNGYLDLALTTGLPGLALAMLFLLIKPMLNFHHCRIEGGNRDLSGLWLQIWIFAIYFNCFESTLFDRTNTVWLFLVAAVFGLHYLARAKINP